MENGFGLVFDDKMINDKWRMENEFGLVFGDK